MIRYLISRIPALLYEAVAVCALLGLLLAALRFRKRRGRFYLPVTAALLFMVGWRLVCPLVFASSRYSDILIYPAVIAAAWFCCFLRDLAAAKRLLAPGKAALIPVICVSLLAGGSLVKVLRPRPYHNHTVKIGQRLRREIAGKNYRLYSTLAPDRLAYYAGIPRDRVVYWAGNPEIMQECRNYFEEIYLVAYAQRDTPEPFAAFLASHPEWGRWESLQREYTSNRRDKEIVLYHFAPGRPEVELRERPLPELSLRNWCPNAGFEEVLDGQPLRDRLDYYRKLGAAEFYTSGKNLFPRHWWLGVGSAGPGESPRLALNSLQPLSGRYSLELAAAGTGEIGVNSGFFPQGEGSFTGFIQALADSDCRISACCQAAGQQRELGSVSLRVGAGKICRFTLPVRLTGIPGEGGSIYIVIRTSGHILVDNVEFLPAD